MTSSKQRVVAGGVTSGLAAVLFAFSGVMKLVGGEQVAAGMEHLGLPAHLIVPIAILELACVVVYLVPATSFLGAVLLTGYLGGAVLAHLRVGDPFFVPILLGAVVWLGLYLRERRLHELLPSRKAR